MGYLLLYIDSAVLNKSITKNYKNSIFQVTNDKGAELYTNHPVEHLNTLKKQGWLDINNKKMYYQNIENEIKRFKNQHLFI